MQSVFTILIEILYFCKMFNEVFKKKREQTSRVTCLQRTSGPEMTSPVRKQRERAGSEGSPFCSLCASSGWLRWCQLSLATEHRNTQSSMLLHLHGHHCSVVFWCGVLNILLKITKKEKGLHAERLLYSKIHRMFFVLFFCPITWRKNIRGRGEDN